MKTRMTRLGAFVACTVGLAVFTGTAIASNGHGNAGTPPGQAKKDQTASAQVSTAAQASTLATVQASASSSNGNSANAPGQKKKAAATSSTTSSTATSTASPGMKPSSSTTSHKWTSCATGGGSGSTATCTGNTAAATLAAKPTDTSKQYGQGKTTAAQIANSRGAPAGTPLTGPGNSQPHKVAVCPHKKNRSGGVDVHAVKSYKTAACATQQSAQVTIGQTQSTTIQAGVAGSAALTTTAAPTAQTTAGAAAGVQATIARPGKGHGAGGVLGAVTRLGVAGTRSTLPFTGFPLWMTVLIALGLISGGLAVRVRTGVAS